MVCTFDSKCSTKLFRKQLDFPCNSDWADLTCGWTESRKRKMPKKEKPPKVVQQKAAASRVKQPDGAKRRNPVYSKALESRSAGYTGRLHKNTDDSVLDAYWEPVKCKVVNFQGLGSPSHFCVSSAMRVSSVPNVNEPWESVDDSVLTHRSDQSMGSTINLDSGLKQNKFHKEQLLKHLHERSAPLLKYLFASGDTARNSELHTDNISLPIKQQRKSMAQIGSNKVKHVIVEPRDFDQIGSDYVGALIPNSSRPLDLWVSHTSSPSGISGYGLLRSPRSVTLSHKTLELPALAAASKIYLPSVNPPPHPVRSSVDEPKVEEGAAYIDSVSQLVGMLCIEPTNRNLPQHNIQKWLDT